MKRGAPKKIESPEKLKEYFEQYKEWVRNNPFLVHDFVGKDGAEVFKVKQRAFNFDSFEAWLHENEIIAKLDDYESNRNGSYTDFSAIIRSIRKQCNANLRDGAVAGVFNGNLASRILGLTDKQEHTHDGTVEIVMTKGKTLL